MRNIEATNTRIPQAPCGLLAKDGLPIVSPSYLLMLPIPAKPLRILAVSGSLRAASLNTLLLQTFATLAPASIDVQLYRHLGDLPLFNPDLETPLPEPVADFKNHVLSADAAVIASPEYAHEVTGVIKNALDWLVGTEAFVNKPVALLNASGRAVHAYAALREIVTMMSANIIDAASLTLPLYGNGLAELDVLANPQTVRDLQAVLVALQQVISSQPLAVENEVR